jgi:hypothetical protein
MKGRLLLIILLLININSFGQDVVYDTVIGNKLNWRRIKTGSTEELISISYENLGFISRSKVLLAAGIWTGLREGVDYRLEDINSDTIIFEYKTNPPLNIILYKYYYNDSTYISFFGLRKAELESELFSGRYLFVCPVIKKSTVNIYQGIGANRKLFLSVKEPIDELLYKDYLVSGQITFQTINGSKQILIPTVLEFIEDEPFTLKVDIFPNPATDLINIQILNNEGFILRIFDEKPQMIYQQYLETDYTTINIKTFKPGLYILIFSSKSNETIQYVHKLIIK